MNKEDGYSIVVIQHFKHKRKSCGYGFLVAAKLDGIYESMRVIQPCTEKQEAIVEMTKRIKAMTLPRYGEDGV